MPYNKYIDKRNRKNKNMYNITYFKTVFNDERRESMAKSKLQNTRTRSILKGIVRNYELYLFLLPAVVILFCFTYMPMYGVQIAFRDFKPRLGITESEWVGLEHFVRFFNGNDVKVIFQNTILLSLYSLAIGFPFPIILALVINQIQVKRFKQTLQVVTYLPHFISTVVMVGIMLILLSPSTGIVGNLYRVFGVTDATKIPNVMAEPSMFRSVYVWSDVWQHTGWDSIIYIAALAAVDPTLYEAGTVDGASKWQKIIYIDIPSLIPTCVILLIMRCGNIMNVGFEKVYLMQNTLNTPVSEIISTYVYKLGIVKTEYSLSAAVGLFNNVINFILLIAVNQISKKISDTSLW